MKPDQWQLWLAQGFGIGRISWAPGTWGSLLGMVWLAVLLVTGCWWICLAGIGAGLVLSIWLSGQAELHLRQRDPPSVVVDEITALPVCFIGWLSLDFGHTGHLLSPVQLFAPDSWPMTAALFAGFRLFDVLKPWPVYQSQSLPGGWGVTADDFLAAVYVNMVWLGGELIWHGHIHG